jgi:xanthine dehydrogenase YagS FAD-binding subunit
VRPFEYAAPPNVDEALALLSPASRPFAGGTDLLTLMKADVAAPDTLVSVKSALERGIHETPNGVTLGALTTLAELEQSVLVRERLPALAEACALAATPQLRNVATIGGNVLQRPRCWYFRSHLVHCWLKGGDECQARDGENQQHAVFDLSPCVAVHPSDPAVALTVYGAEVTLRGPRGERTLSIDDFFAPPDDERRTETTIGEHELVTAIHVPFPPDGERSVYLKAMDRKIWAFALVSVAAVVRIENGRVEDARLVLGGVANVPYRALGAVGHLVGAAPSEEAFARVAEAVVAGAQPLARNGYKLQLLKGLVKQALRAATM